LRTAAPLEVLIRRIPKAELHMHLEGSLEPELMFELAARNGVSLPHGSVEELRRAYEFENLQDFLDLYYQGARVLRTVRDFHDLTAAYFRRAIEANIRHAEIFFDPQTHTTRGIALPAVVEGISTAMREAERTHGVSSGLIPCFLRDAAPADAMATLEEVLTLGDRIVGVGLDSAERGNPPAAFAAVFARARAAGLRTVAHAGEEGPAAYVRQALELLHVSRIDHGVRCEEDTALVSELAAKRIPLTVCPLSNVKLRVFPSLEQHNLRRLLTQGLCVTINSDDPAYFGGYVNENFLGAQRALGLTGDEVYRLARNSFEGSFLDETRKQRLIDELETTMTAHRQSNLSA
jgi:adenine deaminase